MSLEHAILGFLQYGPSSGYDLKSAFDQSVRHFWPADQSQIYRTLARLSEHGWAEIEVVEQDDRPDKKLYRITEAGRRELTDWLLNPPLLKGGRNAFLVQVFFAGRLPNENVLNLFRQAADRLRTELAVLEDVPENSQAILSQAPPREGFCWMLTLECGLHIAKAYLTWLESVIARLERGELPAVNATEDTTCTR